VTINGARTLCARSGRRVIDSLPDQAQDGDVVVLADNEQRKMAWMPEEVAAPHAVSK